MRKIAAFLLLSIPILVGCESERSYYSARCDQRGFERGTAAHETCMIEERDWIERTYRAGDENSRH